MAEHDHSWQWEEGSAGAPMAYCSGCGVEGEECEVCQLMVPVDGMNIHLLWEHNIDRFTVEWDA